MGGFEQKRTITRFVFLKHTGCNVKWIRRAKLKAGRPCQKQLPELSHGSKNGWKEGDQSK